MKILPEIHSIPRSHPSRIAALDMLRACALLSVVIYHSVQMSPVPLPTLSLVTTNGQYGVDLFFVLSGWLIGGLYWREMQLDGQVNIARFWGRRWLRTLPPYFVALALSWGAVRFSRGEPFDPGYLLFLQNYEERIPYFLVSWSLCVEEHFYLVAPLLAGALFALTARRYFWIACVGLLAVSPLCRWLEWNRHPAMDFGYIQTATHLRLDGLVMGFAMSFIAIHSPRSFGQLRSSALPILAATIGGLVAIRMIGGPTCFALWPLLVSIVFAAVLVATGTKKSDDRGWFPWSAIALSSYSAYLVHPLAIHVAILLAAGNSIIYWPAAATVTIAGTALLYFTVEKPAILLRDTYLPRRALMRGKAMSLGGKS
ncbi:acyltransferase family protein [Hyphomicrobium facile]|uniref:Peptidoglycan/LPS O-acetylase OafA/YrhL, contains acyltransferase and SGNH-hydrolase domains n=1 Tax=Hyphomicrobium facile TaxID=51670 RepID=A0A1I7NRX1_9HYPH|nr:acyltransferase [Hyphomicrobium facile]SFV37396.1 Peptidoglycan/LPS O-acetylase OafA/YrhL, contains acyltransferase and SGNH-hydrolase domains [Hyphomicrobium facile]